MEKIKKEKCKTCRYYNFLGENKQVNQPEKYGECRYNAPAADINPSATFTFSALDFIFPRTSPDTWCGKYKIKKQ